jgi:hypothetical protein
MFIKLFLLAFDYLDQLDAIKQKYPAYFTDEDETEEDELVFLYNHYFNYY